MRQDLLTSNRHVAVKRCLTDAQLHDDQCQVSVIRYERCLRQELLLTARAWDAPVA